MEEDRKVLNGYGVLFALCVAKESGKNPSEIIDLLTLGTSRRAAT